MLRTLISRGAWLGLALSLAACGSVAPDGDGASAENSAAVSTAALPANDAPVRRDHPRASDAISPRSDVSSFEFADAATSATGLTWLSTTLAVPPSPTSSGTNLGLRLELWFVTGGIVDFDLNWNGKSWEAKLTYGIDYNNPDGSLSYRVVTTSPIVTVRPGDSIGTYLSGSGTSNWLAGINVNGGLATDMQFSPGGAPLRADVSMSHEYTQTASCSSYPQRSETVQVSAIINGAWASPTWTTNTSQATCMASLTTTPTSVSFNWSPPPPPPPPACTATPRICCTKPYLPGC